MNLQQGQQSWGHGLGRSFRELPPAVAADLADAGRVLLRPSGTEPLIRVMVEAVDEARLDAAMDKLVTVLKAASQE